MSEQELTPEQVCSHGHALRRKCRICSAMDDQAEIERLEDTVSRYMTALDLIANAAFEMKAKETIALMRRTAREALDGGPTWWEKKR